MTRTAGSHNYPKQKLWIKMNSALEDWMSQVFQRKFLKRTVYTIPTDSASISTQLRCCSLSSHLNSSSDAVLYSAIKTPSEKHTVHLELTILSITENHEQIVLF